MTTVLNGFKILTEPWKPIIIIWLPRHVFHYPPYYTGTRLVTWYEPDSICYGSDDICYGLDVICSLGYMCVDSISLWKNMFGNNNENICECQL